MLENLGLTPRGEGIYENRQDSSVLQVAQIGDQHCVEHTMASLQNLSKKKRINNNNPQRKIKQTNKKKEGKKKRKKEIIHKAKNAFKEELGGGVCFAWHRS